MEGGKMGVTGRIAIGYGKERKEYSAVAAR